MNLATFHNMSRSTGRGILLKNPETHDIMDQKVNGGLCCFRRSIRRSHIGILFHFLYETSFSDREGKLSGKSPASRLLFRPHTKVVN